MTSFDAASMLPADEMDSAPSAAALKESRKRAQKKAKQALSREHEKRFFEDDDLDAVGDIVFEEAEANVAYLTCPVQPDWRTVIIFDGVSYIGSRRNGGSLAESNGSDTELRAGRTVLV